MLYVILFGESSSSNGFLSETRRADVCRCRRLFGASAPKSSSPSKSSIGSDRMRSPKRRFLVSIIFRNYFSRLKFFERCEHKLLHRDTTNTLF
uniref:Uncharacterized protein n=1 Tax=Romanomermis culicivorax TaxID=13658 RepID=A0A915K0R2_ROMCU